MPHYCRIPLVHEKIKMKQTNKKKQKKEKMSQWPLVWKSAHIWSFIPTPAHLKTVSRTDPKSVITSIITRTFWSNVWRQKQTHQGHNFDCNCFPPRSLHQLRKFPYFAFFSWSHFQFFFHAILPHFDVTQVYQESTHLHSLQHFLCNTFEIRIGLYIGVRYIFFLHHTHPNYFLSSNSSITVSSSTI